jgi:hypothetical protein
MCTVTHALAVCVPYIIVIQKFCCAENCVVGSDEWRGDILCIFGLQADRASMPQPTNTDSVPGNNIIVPTLDFNTIVLAHGYYSNEISACTPLNPVTLMVFDSAPVNITEVPPGFDMNSM